MNEKNFPRNMDRLRQEIEGLQQWVATDPSHLPKIVRQAIQNLWKMLEKLQTAEQELVAFRQALEAERQQYRDLFEFSPDSYIITDLAGVIQDANRATMTLLSLPQTQLEGKLLLSFVSAEHQTSFRTHLTRLIQLEQLPAWEISLQTSDKKTVAIRGTVIKNLQGQPIGLRWLFRDLSNQKWIE